MTQNYYGANKVQSMEEFHLGGKHYATISIVVPRKDITETPGLILAVTPSETPVKVEEVIDVPKKVEEPIDKANPAVPETPEEPEVTEEEFQAAVDENKDGLKDFVDELDSFVEDDSKDVEKTIVAVHGRNKSEIVLGTPGTKEYNAKLEENGFDNSMIELVLSGSQKTHKAYSFKLI